MRNENKIIYASTITIMLIGLAALYSATYERGQRPMSPLFLKQVVWFCLAVVMLFAAANFNYRRIYDYAYLIYGFGVLLLLVVLVLGRRILGAQRWLELGGLNLQPSEPMKLGIILVLCRWFSVKGRFSRNYAGYRLNQVIRQFLPPFALTAIPAGLIFMQPDLGTAVLYILIFFVVLFISGAPKGLVFTPVIAGLLASPVFWHFLKAYQKDRLRV
ncbi:MAG: FtsW/RodA/SpoVE family cell cycle protein, partial [Candidatus Omnitrophota bacterium]